MKHSILNERKVHGGGESLTMVDDGGCANRKRRRRRRRRGERAGVDEDALLGIFILLVTY
jgi:hypothetical protein